MAIDVVGYLESTDVDLVYSGENVGTNDIAMECPFCGDDPSTHLTVHRTTGYLNCWRCEFVEYKARSTKGWRPSFKALIKEIEQCTWGEAKEIFESIGGESGGVDYGSKVRQEVTVEKCELPPGTYPFNNPGPFSTLRDSIYNYLNARGFTRYHIDKYRLLFCTTGVHQGRVIIPFYSGGKIVNWMGRRTNPESKGRYMNCRIDKCVTRMANMLYGQETWAGNVLRLVEGAFDKMRIGESALGLSRSQFSAKQRNIVLQLGKYVKYISLILDPEADKRALGIAEELSVGGKRIKIVQLPLGKDPAEMKPEEILYHENKAEFFRY